jgi:hypothetical protein
MLDLDRLPPALARRDASEYLERKHGVKLAPATLASLACLGKGPSFRKDGRRPIYPVSGLDEYAEGRLSPVVRSTSELPAANEGISASDVARRVALRDLAKQSPVAA